jgi:hypothetical protein
MYPLKPSHLEEQVSDTLCRQLSTLVGAHPSIDFDDFGALSHVPSSGEFQLALPKTLSRSTPHTLFTELSFPPPEPIACVRGDASHLSREEVLTANSNSTPVMAHTVTEAVLPQALQLEEIIREQANHPTFRELTDLCSPDTLSDRNASGLLVRKAPLDGSEQIVIPAALQPRLLHLEHYPRTAGHPGNTRIFRSLRRRYFWKDMDTDVANTVKNCAIYGKDRIHERKRTSFLKLFPASEPLDFVSLDILGPPQNGTW